MQITLPRGLILGFLCVLALAGTWSGAFSLLLGNATELSYASGVEFSTCNPALSPTPEQRASCATSYSLTVGNTGTKNLDHIEIQLAALPELMMSDYRTLDVVASNNAVTDPDVQGVGTEKLVIRNLAANQMVVVSMTATGTDAALSLDNMNAAVTANAVLINVHPQTGALARFFRVLLSFA